MDVSAWVNERESGICVPRVVVCMSPEPGELHQAAISSQ